MNFTDEDDILQYKQCRINTMLKSMLFVLANSLAIYEISLKINLQQYNNKH